MNQLAKIYSCKLPPLGSVRQPRTNGWVSIKQLGVIMIPGEGLWFRVGGIQYRQTRGDCVVLPVLLIIFQSVEVWADRDLVLFYFDVPDQMLSQLPMAVRVTPRCWIVGGTLAYPSQDFEAPSSWFLPARLPDGVSVSLAGLPPDWNKQQRLDLRKKDGIEKKTEAELSSSVEKALDLMGFSLAPGRKQWDFELEQTTDHPF
jgi:hypothetical protein